MIKALQNLFMLTLCIWSGIMPAVANAATSEDPEQIIRTTTEQVLDALKGEARTDLKAAEKLITNKVLPVIEFPTFAKLSLGTHWKTATPAQREQFMREFQSMLIRTYAKHMLQHTDTQVNYLPTREEEKFTFVSTELIPGQGKAPLQVTYRLKHFDDGWKAVDITVDGLSMAKNFRTSFVDEVNQTSLDALIDRLAQANNAGNT